MRHGYALHIRLLGYAQIHQLYLASAGQHYVVGLDVPMHDMLHIRSDEHVNQFADDDQRLVLSEALDGAQHFLAAHSIHIFHGNVVEIQLLVLAKVIDVDDVLIVDGGGQHGLLAEACNDFFLAFRFQQRILDDFEGAKPAHAFLQGKIHDAHSTLAYFAHYAVLAIDDEARIELIRCLIKIRWHLHSSRYLHGFVFIADVIDFQGIIRVVNGQSVVFLQIVFFVGIHYFSFPG